MSHSGYGPGYPDQVPYSQVYLAKNVISNITSGYYFFMDAQPRTYHISVTVTYVGGGGGTSTLDVTSALPTFTTSVVQPGSVAAAPANAVVNGQSVPANVVIGELNQASSTQIKATTGPEANPYFAEDYMWMQLIYAAQSIDQRTANGSLEHTKQTPGLVIDDGDTARTPLGQPLVEGGTSWASDLASELPYGTTGTVAVHRVG